MVAFELGVRVQSFLRRGVRAHDAQGYNAYAQASSGWNWHLKFAAFCDFFSKSKGMGALIYDEIFHISSNLLRDNDGAVGVLNKHWSGTAIEVRYATRPSVLL